MNRSLFDNTNALIPIGFSNRIVFAMLFSIPHNIIAPSVPVDIAYSLFFYIVIATTVFL